MRKVFVKYGPGLGPGPKNNVLKTVFTTFTHKLMLEKKF